MKSMNLLKALGIALVCVATAWTNMETRAKDGDFYVTNARNLVSKGRAERANVEQGTPQQQIGGYSNDDSKGLVSLEVDRKDRVYNKGDNVVLNVRSSVDGYLYLINFNPEGDATLLFPNLWHSDNKIVSGVPTTLPTEEMDFDLEVQGPVFGVETIKAFVTPEPLKLSDEAKSAEFHTFSDAECKQLLDQVKSSIEKPIKILVLSRNN